MYDPFQALRPKALRSELEPLARKLYDLACCGSSSTWKDIEHHRDLSSNPDLKKRFLTCAHNGMEAAQKLIVKNQGHFPYFSPQRFIFKSVQTVQESGTVIRPTQTVVDTIIKMTTILAIIAF